MKPFRTPILILAAFDLALPLIMLGGGGVLQALFPGTCLGSDANHNGRLPLCIAPSVDLGVDFFFLGLFAMMVLWPLTAVLIILSEILGWRRARRLLKDSARPSD